MEIENIFEYQKLISKKKEDIQILNTLRYDVSRSYTKQNPIKKIIYFIYREGFFKTIKKIRSRVYYNKVEKEHLLVEAKNSDNYYLYGYQFSQNQPIYYFFKTSTEKMVLERFQGLNPFVSFPEKFEGIELSKSYTNHFIPIIEGAEEETKFPDYNLFAIGFGDYCNVNVINNFKDFHKLFLCEFDYNILACEKAKKFYMRTNDFSQIRKYSELKSKVNLAIISTYHSYHASQAVYFLKSVPNSKAVIEKPPAVTFKDLDLLLEAFDPKRVFIGYNRRYIKTNQIIRKMIKKYNDPVIINMEIKELALNQNHWYFAPNQGTRIIGNLCHWIDLASFLIDLRPIEIGITKNKKLGIDYSIFTIQFEDGSIVNLIPSDWGDGIRGVTEKITIRSKSYEINIDDYLKIKIWENGKQKICRYIRRDKGHENMYRCFHDWIINNLESDYKIKDLIYSSFIYMKFVELFNSDESVLSLDFSAYNNYLECFN